MPSASMLSPVPILTPPNTLFDAIGRIYPSGKIIEIRGQRIENYRLLDENWSDRLTNQVELSTIEKSKLKEKAKKRGRIILLESGLLVGLLTLLIVI